MKTKIIAIANQKGGVSKTTTTLAMANVLQKKGYKTLIVDTDIQGNTSGVYKAQMNETETLYDVIFEEPRSSGFESIQTTEAGDIIASDPLLIQAESKLSENQESICYLKEGLDRIRETGVYDFIIIDTNPYIGSMLYSSLIAADQVIVPMEADIFSLEGVDMFQETMASVKENYNPDLKMVGYLLTQFNPRVVLSREIREDLHAKTEELGTYLFDTTIRSSQKVKDAQASRKPLLEYAPKSTSAIDYIKFVEEYLEIEGENDGSKK